MAAGLELVSYLNETLVMARYAEELPISELHLEFNDLGYPQVT